MQFEEGWDELQGKTFLHRQLQEKLMEENKSKIGQEQKILISSFA